MTTSQIRPQWKDMEWHRSMRDRDPVWRDPDNGTWHVFRYADAAAILNDPKTFSSDVSLVIPGPAELTEGNIITMDPPRHHRLRSLVSRAFTPKAIAALSNRIAELTTELLDGLPEPNRFELVAALAYPLPVIVIAELLGVPTEDRELFKDWADALLSKADPDITDPGTVEEVLVDLRRFHDYLRGHVAARRARPHDDLLGNLVAAEIDGERLDDTEIVGFATILLIAGHITTTALLGNALLCLDEYPEAQDALRADPAGLPLAIEEVLRHTTPFAQTTRVNLAEVELAGRTIPERQLVNIWLSSANRDERQFDHPDEFVADRDPNPHLGLGRGIHFCLGAPLARLEGRIALEILLRRYRTLRVDRGQPIEPQPDPGVNGVKTLHILAEPA